MRALVVRVAIATLIVVQFPRAASSQSAASSSSSRSPVWGALSAGRGDLRVNCEICRRNDQSSWAADVAVGGWIGARTALGGELGAWRRGGKDATQRVMLVGAVSQLYPLRRAAAFAKLGLGLMSYRSTDGEQALSARSLAVQAGFGYDIRVQHRYLVVPCATLVQGFNHGLYLDGERATGASQMKLLRFGIGVGVGR